MKFLIFIGIAAAIYILLVRPFFIGAAKARSEQGGLGDMMDAFNKMREQMQNGGKNSGFSTNDGRMKVNNTKAKNTNSSDDGEYTDYEEIK